MKKTSQNSQTFFLLTTVACGLLFLASTASAENKSLPNAYPRYGLVSFWPANGNAADIIGKHNGVLFNSANYTNGIAGGAFNFDNSAGIFGGWSSSVFPGPAFDGGNFMSVPDSTAWSFGTGDFTISLWAKFNAETVNDIGHSQGGVFISHDDGAFDEKKWWFSLGGGVLNVHINDPAQGPVFLVNAPFTPIVNQWYHYTLTRKGNLFTVYVNGAAIGTDTSSRAIPDAAGPLNLGEAEGYYFNGQMDNVAIYKRALPAWEIKKITKSGDIDID